MHCATLNLLAKFDLLLNTRDQPFHKTNCNVMSSIFSQIKNITTPKSAKCDKDTHRNAQFKIAFEADGEVPFPQIILRQQGREHVFTPDALSANKAKSTFTLTVPEGLLCSGEVQVQAEGCKKTDISQSGGDDWVKAFDIFEIKASKARKPVIKVASANGADVKIYFSIHKHMHQPYYKAADKGYWDSEKDGIFGQRGGAYTHYVPAAVRQYAEGGLPHGGLSTSWSGSLIAQLNRAGVDGLCGGAFSSDWAGALRDAAQLKTEQGNPRCDFSAFGYYHPLMALIPHRNIVRQVKMHRDIIRDTFGVEASDVMFPPETAFHVRMIPALNEAGIKAVMYDSIHRTRACVDYPYGGKEEGMLPPNQADQVNPPVDDWMQLNNIWAASKISPSLLRPEYIKYQDAEGVEHKIIGIPAERYIGNEDARGGFGALQYPDVFQQIYNRVIETGTFDPKHPPFFILHSDGDNYGGGTDSYYYHNTGSMVEWLKGDPRFELMAAKDYLELFPPDESNAIHVEPGSWSGADNGDPQFKKWFGMYTEPYSPDLNSWAVLTALQNIVHSLEDAAPDTPGLDQAIELMLTAETSCYWYWTGQQDWDWQVTGAANAALEIVASAVQSLASRDQTGPTIFPAWIIPENPGGETWGNNCLKPANKQAQLHTFIYDLAGIESANLVIRSGQKEQVLKLNDNGAYPAQTGATRVANLYTADLPMGLGDVRFYIEATDRKGNTSRGSLDRIFLA
jgi:hypothetical protein